jgi:hypothetical protein
MTLCRRRLATVWFAGVGLIVGLQVFQTIFGQFGSRADEAWGWLLPNVIPTSSLMISVLVLETLGRGPHIQAADAFLYRLTMALCSVYLLLVIGALLLQPAAGVPPIDLMKQSNLWLGPIQGLVSAALAGFFMRAEPTTEGAPARAAAAGAADG